MKDAEENGLSCYVLYGFYPDKSGGKLIGVYTLKRAAEDRAACIRSAGSDMHIRIATMALERCSPVDLLVLSP